MPSGNRAGATVVSYLATLSGRSLMKIGSMSLNWGSAASPRASLRSLMCHCSKTVSNDGTVGSLLGAGAVTRMTWSSEDVEGVDPAADCGDKSSAGLLGRVAASLFVVVCVVDELPDGQHVNCRLICVAVAIGTAAVRDRGCRVRTSNSSSEELCNKSVGRGRCRASAFRTLVATGPTSEVELGVVCGLRTAQPPSSELITMLCLLTAV